MSDIRNVTAGFAVAPQISSEALPGLAAAGFRMVINNRPDGEAPDQPSGAEIRSAAAAAGLAYAEIPIRGMATPDQVREMRDLVDSADGKVLAFCRSGTRSITAWALGRAEAGDGPAAVAAALNAGYDLRALIG